MELRPRTAGVSLDSLHRYGNTDHWTKLKVRANCIREAKTADVLNRSSSSEFGQEASERTGHRLYTVDKVPSATQELPVHNCKRSSEQKINVFSDEYLSVGIPKSGIQKHWLNNCYQRRAREGFRYWLINRPVPTSYAKYGFGSYKMVLGLGAAPRT